METKIILLVVLLAIGALQGIVFGSILWRTNNLHRRAHRFLAAILFFFSYRLIAEILHFFGLGRYDTWYYFLLEYNWIYGALIYFFVLSYLNPEFKLQRKHWIHFLPVGIEVIWSFFIKAQNFYWDGTRESLSWLGYWGYVVWMHYPTMFVVAGILILYYAHRAYKLVINPPQVPGYKIIPENIQWIKRVLIALVLFSIIFTLLTVIETIFFNYAFSFIGYPIFIVLAIITYWLGLEGFSRRNVIAFKLVEIPSDKEMEQLQAVADKIEEAMNTDRLYAEQDLTQAKLAEAINTKTYLVSKAMTVVFQKKFSDYINELRFKRLQELLEDPANEKYTLLSLAFDAGFNSKASFNRAIKKITGQSPKHLRPR